jgi:hypothetical protein
METPHPDHAEFDAICEDIADYEPLPEMLGPSSYETAGTTDDELTDTIDAEILAGLVTP